MLFNTFLFMNVLQIGHGENIMMCDFHIKIDHIILLTLSIGCTSKANFL